ncbi:hypothetical protein ACIRS1_19345 [Kitasatospora sp. NPDC101176]|uniref:hypothetical protein n=1 Tax=Kitasatospora sp. NPDC101176 TaxID=3364099 RepID=UPI0037FE4CBF
MLTAAVVVVAAAAATTIPAAGVTAACGAAPGPGRAASPVADSLVEARRADGRTEQFQQFYDDSATPGPRFVWHRSQEEPGGEYGAWERVSATPVGPKLYQVSAVENGRGGLEVFIASYGSICRTVLATPDGRWSAAEGFELAPPPYHGGITLFKERDGRLHAFAAGNGSSGAMEVRSQRDGSGDAWGPVRPLPGLPEPGRGLSAPSSVVQLADGRLQVTAREWNADRYWRTSEADRFGSWVAWRLCADGTCG